MIRSDNRANDYNEIKPLIDLCKAGRLFDVQEWIADGKPINPPPPPAKGARKKCPLQVSIDKGFHSLVQVLLESGAIVQDGSFNALELALGNRRLDLIKLLVEHGADVRSVDMPWVFDSWDPAIMEYFIDQGADVETGYPLAEALCCNIRTALGVFKRHKNRFPSFQDQVNMALRYHCKEGNLKWVSLLLWAGADPFAKGPDSPDEDPDPEEGLCALEYAALYKHFDIFKLKNIRISPDHPIASDLLENACRADKADFLVELLNQGFNPADEKDRGSSLIETCLHYLQWAFDYDWFTRERKSKDIDTSRSRETLKMIHILAKNGAKWVPTERYQINDARRSLLKMSVDYTVEFVWIMAKYDGCSRDTIEQLLRTPTIRRHVVKHQPRIQELLKEFGES
ncbi:MAG: ankyrin repeat domain-containing protein [Thermodesulfobacteriota bacterium]